MQLEERRACSAGRDVHAAGAGGGWDATVLNHLDSFLDAGRRPHPAVNGMLYYPFTNIAFGGPLKRTTVHGTDTIRLFKGSLNSICNKHTFAHCDFGERLETNAPVLSFFAPTVRKPELVARITNLAHATLMMVMHRYYPYLARTVAGHNIGLRRTGTEGLNTVYSLEHFYPRGYAQFAQGLAKMAQDTGLFKP